MGIWVHIHIHSLPTDLSAPHHSPLRYYNSLPTSHRRSDVTFVTELIFSYSYECLYRMKLCTKQTEFSRILSSFLASHLYVFKRFSKLKSYLITKLSDESSIVQFFSCRTFFAPRLSTHLSPRRRQTFSPFPL